MYTHLCVIPAYFGSAVFFCTTAAGGVRENASTKVVGQVVETPSGYFLGRVSPHVTSFLTRGGSAEVRFPLFPAGCGIVVCDFSLGTRASDPRRAAYSWGDFVDEVVTMRLVLKRRGNVHPGVRCECPLFPVCLRLSLERALPAAEVRSAARASPQPPIARTTPWRGDAWRRNKEQRNERVEKRVSCFKVFVRANLAGISITLRWSNSGGKRERKRAIARGTE